MGNSTDKKRNRLETIILSILLCVIAPVLVHTNAVVVADEKNKIIKITQKTSTGHLIDAEGNEDLNLKH